MTLERLKGLTDELAAVLTDTDVYKDYITKRKTITKSDTEKIAEFKELREKAIMCGSKEDEYRASELYRALMLRSATREYLLSEKRLLRTINGIYDDIVSNIDIL